MNLNQIKIILLETSHPGNIGSVARAMKTMGLKHLTLVQPKLFPDVKATEMAAGADDILLSAQVVSSFDEAIAECHWVIGTSARSRDLEIPVLYPKELVQTIQPYLVGNSSVGIVFGRERNGMTNDELVRCHWHVQIPTDPAFSSLNLAQAVQIVSYEFRCLFPATKAQSSRTQREVLATQIEVEGFYQQLESLIKEIDFYKPRHSGRLQARLRRMLGRIHLERMEVNILRGILTHLQQHLDASNAS